MILANNSLELKNLSLIFYHQIVYYLCIIFVLMVFIVTTSSDCKVKEARFYEFLYTLG